MSEQKNYNNNENNSHQESLESSQSQQDEILRYLKQGEETSGQILKSLKFIRRYYFWRSLINSLKIIILVIVVIFGIVSWDSIVATFSNTSLNLQEQIGEAVQEGISDKMNNN